MTRFHKLAVTALPAVFILSSCFRVGMIGPEVSTSVGGNETLQVASDEPMFFDRDQERAVGDALLSFTKPTGGFALSGANPVAGTEEYLGQAGEMRAAEWQETMNGVASTCRGWFTDTASAWSCAEGGIGLDAPNLHPPSVEFLVDCHVDGTTRVSAFALDSRVTAIGIDLVDGTRLVGADPYALGFVGLTTDEPISQAFAQDADGATYSLVELATVAACPSA